MFNQLTGANQHVGNFPGVTVDRKDGTIRKHSEAVVTDLPGIYSLSPYSSEEIVTRDFLMDTHPDGIINIVDATNVERNLYLTMQLRRLYKVGRSSLSCHSRSSISCWQIIIYPDRATKNRIKE